MPQNPAIMIEMNALEASSMLTGAQIRAGRALLRWSATELSARSGVSYASIQRAEAVDTMPSMNTKNLLAIKTTLEKAGCLFFDGQYSGDGGHGVRLTGQRSGK